ncbi:MAG TPA: protein translocase subunit SecD [Pirellulales bacterium]|jgi:SecD/SecF fusion protein|nr:protein translocase subunit SecD [Pirellulales bacterium]
MFSFSYLSLLLAQAVPEATLDDRFSTPQKLAIAVLVLVGSFGLGNVLGKALRMPEYGTKIGLVLATLFAGILIDVFGWPPKLGIDLSGGVVLIYEVDQNQMQETNRGQILDQLTHQLGSVDGHKLKPRLNAGGIEIPLPDEALAPKVEQRIAKFIDKGLAITPVGVRRVDGEPVLVYTIESQRKQIDMEKLIGAVSKRINPSGVAEVTVRRYGNEQLEVIVPEVEQREVDQIKRIISTSGNLQFRILANRHDHRDIVELAEQSPSDEVFQGGKLKARWIEMRAGANSGDTITRKRNGVEQVLIMIDDYNVNGDYLAGAAPGHDHTTGAPCIDFSFNSQGANRFSHLTQENIPDAATGFQRSLGIVLDNVLQSAAHIRSAISDRGQITGNFSDEYVDFVVGVLNAGSLPAALQKEPISEQKISAQLGDDTIRSASIALIISTIAVVVFMLVYYRFAGIVADIAVLMNMVLATALMILIKAAFTLPGLAGFVLTVGMAVDANVLIYERIREETHRGASLRMAIRNGFSRAMATIIDSHLTTVFTAVVLYTIGTDQIKGFAVSLILGLAVSLYTAVYVARVILDVAERKRWITKLHMMQFIGETHIDFVRWRGPAIAASTIVIAIGMAAVYLRGADLFDIDFTGGVSVQILLKPDHRRDIADVRQLVSDLPDVAVSSVGTAEMKDREYKIDTSERDMAKVQQRLQEKFGDDLATYTLDYRSAKSTSAKSDEGAAASGPSLPGESAQPEGSKPDSAPPESKSSESTTLESKSPGAAPSEGKEPVKTPADGKSSDARRLPADSLLALAGDADDPSAGLLLAQATTPAKSAPAAKPPTPAAKPPTTKTPAAEDKPAATEKPAAEEKPATTPASESTTTEPDSAKSDSAKSDSAKPDTGDTTPAESTLSESTKPAVLVKYSLHFGEEINRPTLMKMIEEDLHAVGLPAVRFDLTNPQYKPGSTHGYKDWELSIPLTDEETEKLLAHTKGRLAQTAVFPLANQIGGKVAGDTKLLATYALLASLAAIVFYVWVRFQNAMFGIAAVLALIHDVLVTVGFLALSKYLAPFFGFVLVEDFKISLAVMAALLTIVGYSINDTIVIFDRIREVRGKNPDLTEKMINDSVNQTLSRTILTSGTVLIGTLILYFIGGPGIHPFAFAMLVGLISGTYSTVYIASPVLLWLKRPLAGPGFAASATAVR